MVREDEVREDKILNSSNSKRLPFLHTPEGIDRLIELRNKGYTNPQIATILGKDNGVKMSSNAIHMRFKSIDNSLANSVVRDKGLRDRANKEMDVITDQLSRLNDKAWEIINNMDSSKADEARTALAASSNILKQIEFTSKKLERLTKPSKLEITNTEFAVFFNKYVDDLVEMGYVKRLKKKKPLELDDGKVIPLEIVVKQSVNDE